MLILFIKFTIKFNDYKESNLTTNSRRTVFFDLDGTLHLLDMFGKFICYLLQRQPLNVVLLVFLFPIIGIALLIKGKIARLPMSLLLWGCTFGHSEARLKRLLLDFTLWFRQHVTSFPQVQARLLNYLIKHDTDIWLITGSPQSLVEQVYSDTTWLPKVNLIATLINRRYGGWVVTLRCLGHEKVLQLERRIGKPLHLYSGYSNSNLDNPLLYFCKYCWRVTSTGELKQIKLRLKTKLEPLRP